MSHYDMTKPKSPSQLEKKKPIPRNAVDRCHVREDGCITGWLKNAREGTPQNKTTKHKERGTRKRKASGRKTSSLGTSIATPESWTLRRVLKVSGLK